MLLAGDRAAVLIGRSRDRSDPRRSAFRDLPGERDTEHAGPRPTSRTCPRASAAGSSATRPRVRTRPAPGLRASFGSAYLRLGAFRGFTVSCAQARGRLGDRDVRRETRSCAFPTPRRCSDGVVARHRTVALPFGHPTDPAGVASRRVRLLTIPISHYCEKARWALDRAGIAYEEERHVQGVHQIVARRAGGGTTVPVLVTAEASSPSRRTSCASPTSGCRHERRLFPPDADERREVEALCRELDEGLGPDARRLIYVLMFTAARQAAGDAVQQPGRAAVGGAELERVLAAGDHATSTATSGSRDRDGRRRRPARPGVVRRDRRASRRRPSPPLRRPLHRRRPDVRVPVGRGRSRHRSTASGSRNPRSSRRRSATSCAPSASTRRAPTRSSSSGPSANRGAARRGGRCGAG